jgi:hypothetical protein
MSNLSTFLTNANAAVAASRPRGRLLFTMDATGSRQPSWSRTKPLTQSMLQEASKIGTLDVSIGFFRGRSDANFSHWTDSASDLLNLMDQVECESGVTQIGSLLDHAFVEHTETPISAMVFIGDTIEENQSSLEFKAQSLGLASPPLPLFIFHERTSDTHPSDRPAFEKLARLTGGAYAPFSEGGVSTLRDLLNAVAAFATGGLRALSNQNSEAARLLLPQIRSNT